ncbi:Chromatin accessibility complex protein 1 [Trichostrongylus colubriformis]|uniref:Chromatin accessibility complex protein 1 n=1 Tax=Trichostrongylus colubriformis TaxID=6319 RepID=A0AAN8FMC1_TRICO
MDTGRESPSDSQLEEVGKDDAGQTALPLSRVKTIIGTVPDALPLSPEALFCIAKGAELFMDHLIKNVAKQYGENIDYDEVAEYVLENDELEYLHDFFPRRQTYEAALRQLKAREEE